MLQVVVAEDQNSADPDPEADESNREPIFMKST